MMKLTLLLISLQTCWKILLALCFLSSWTFYSLLYFPFFFLFLRNLLVALKVRIRIIFLLFSICLSFYLTIRHYSNHVVNDSITSSSIFLYIEVKSWSLCLPAIGSAGQWLKYLYASLNNSFLNNMYLHTSMRYTPLVLYDDYI